MKKRAAYIDLRMRLEERPAGKKSDAAARKYYDSQYYAVGRNLAAKEREAGRTEEVQRLRNLDAAGQGDAQDDDNDADEDDGDAGRKVWKEKAKKDSKRPKKKVKIADAAEEDQDEDGGNGGFAKPPARGKGKGKVKEGAGAQVITKTAKLKKSKGKNKAAMDDDGDGAAAASLAEDDGDGEVPAATDGKGAAGRPKSARQIAEEEEGAFAKDPEGVTKGGDVADINTGKKTAAGGFIIGQVYPPFGPAGGQWENGWEDQGTHLGTGGQGCVFLYRRFDDGAVVDRVVVKDSMLSGTEWSCFYKWHPEVSDLENRIPMEVHCLQTLRDRVAQGDKDYCIAIRGHRVENRSMWYRLYTAWCKHDSLFGRFIGDRDERRKTTNVPEPALVAIFGDLIKGFLVLQTGGVDAAVADWTPMVHRDLKLANVFLDARPTGADFPSYPKAMFGDFGMANMTKGEDDPHSPFACSQSGAGTPRWKAPEQILFRSRRTLLPLENHNWKMGAKTNIWGIGAIMVRLMNRGAEGPPGDKYSPLYEHGKEETPVMVSSAIKTYSEDLRNLVLRCCSFDPNARPDLVALRDELEDLVDADGKGLDQGLRHDHLGDDEENLRLRYKPVLEGFAIKQ